MIVQSNCLYEMKGSFCIFMFYLYFLLFMLLNILRNKLDSNEHKFFDESI